MYCSFTTTHLPPMSSLRPFPPRDMKSRRQRVQSLFPLLPSPPPARVPFLHKKVQNSFGILCFPPSPPPKNLDGERKRRGEGGRLKPRHPRSPFPWHCGRCRLFHPPPPPPPVETCPLKRPLKQLWHCKHAFLFPVSSCRALLGSPNMSAQV